MLSIGEVWDLRHSMQFLENMVSFDTDKRKGDSHKGMLEGQGLTTRTKQQFRPKKANRKAIVRW